MNSVALRLVAASIAFSAGNTWCSNQPSTALPWALSCAYDKFNSSTSRREPPTADEVCKEHDQMTELRSQKRVALTAQLHMSNIRGAKLTLTNRMELSSRHLAKCFRYTDTGSSKTNADARPSRNQDRGERKREWEKMEEHGTSYALA
jgi:hypothetical protein